MICSSNENRDCFRFPGEHRFISSPELNDLEHVDSADQFKLVVPAGGHHGREKLVHQLLTMKMNSGAFIFARQLDTVRFEFEIHLVTSL